MEVTNAYGTIPAVEQESNTTSSGTVAAEELKLDFLKLLTAQLQYQDPLEPATNTEFTSQMAQFSSLDAQQQSNSLLQQLLESQGTNQMNQAVSYIGKQVVVTGNKTEIQNGEATVRFRMPSAGVANIQLYNQYGELAKTVDSRYFPEGEGSAVISGPGLDDSTLSDGLYTFSIQMTDDSGEQAAVTTLEAGDVTGVINEGGEVMLDLNGRLVPVGSVRRIEQGNT